MVGILCAGLSNHAPELDLFGSGLLAYFGFGFWLINMLGAK